MKIAVVLYDRFTALDAIGPYEVLSRLPGAELSFVAGEAGPVKTDNGVLTLLAERALTEMTEPDIVLVPGGPGEVADEPGERCSSGFARSIERARGRRRSAPVR
jgi:putative intracellular protease/amidase